MEKCSTCYNKIDAEMSSVRVFHGDENEWELRKRDVLLYAVCLGRTPGEGRGE
jgi:hypothetical protein